MRTQFADVTDSSVMMPFRWNGSYRHMPKLHVESGPRGVRKMMRAIRRAEAEVRNLTTPHHNTRRHRLNRCTEAEHAMFYNA